MRVSTILHFKGANVATVSAETPVAEAAGMMRLHGVGALVVSPDGRHVEGIISERDIVRRLAEHGADVMAEPVGLNMTRNVHICRPSDTSEQLMATMTEQRVRHLPVVEDGMLMGIVSIGDIVASRVRELEEEAQVLHDYITSGR
jgi:CBS domain-containing protein